MGLLEHFLQGREDILAAVLLHQSLPPVLEKIGDRCDFTVGMLVPVMVGPESPADHRQSHLLFLPRFSGTCSQQRRTGQGQELPSSGQRSIHGNFSGIKDPEQIFRFLYRQDNKKPEELSRPLNFLYSRG